MSKYLLAIAFLITTSCQTGIFIRETPAALTNIRKAVVMVLGEPRSVSENGRELVSQYHDRKGKMDPALAHGKSRYYTTVTILGDRRPYDIQVQVFEEARMMSNHYEIIAEDYRLARQRARDIEKALNESLKDRNVIDDFRAF